MNEGEEKKNSFQKPPSLALEVHGKIDDEILSEKLPIFCIYNQYIPVASCVVFFFCSSASSS